MCSTLGHSHTAALRTQWVKRYLDPSEGHWKFLLDHWIKRNSYKSREALLLPEQARRIAVRIPDSFPILEYFKNAILNFSTLDFQNKTIIPRDKDALMATPVWEGATDISMFSDLQIETLNEMEIKNIGDLWDDDNGAFWRSRTMRHTWATPAQRDNLGNHFRSTWYNFLAQLNPTIKQTLLQPDYFPYVGDIVAYTDNNGTIQYGKVVSSTRPLLYRELLKRP